MTDGQGKGEFGRIRDYFAPLTGGDEDSFDLTDDAALLNIPATEKLVVTTDMIVRGVHFLDNDQPEDIAAKALRVNLSDLAGKGARPVAYTLNLALPRDVSDDWVARFAQGLADDQDRFGIRLLGGDSVSTPGPITISVTAFGATPADCYPWRGGGHSEDILFVSGTIGDGALGLMAAKGAFGFGDEADFLATRYRRPEPRLALGQVLRGLVNASMDISDGLVGDIEALALASGCTAVLDAPSIPLSDAAASVIADQPHLMAAVMTGGDDYELLLAISPDKVADAMAAAAGVNIPLTKVGFLHDNGVAGDLAVLDQDGKRMSFSQQKYTHA